MWSLHSVKHTQPDFAYWCYSFFIPSVYSYYTYKTSFATLRNGSFIYYLFHSIFRSWNNVAMSGKNEKNHLIFVLFLQIRRGFTWTELHEFRESSNLYICIRRRDLYRKSRVFHSIYRTTDSSYWLNCNILVSWTKITENNWDWKVIKIQQKNKLDSKHWIWVKLWFTWNWNAEIRALRIFNKGKFTSCYESSRICRLLSNFPAKDKQTIPFCIRTMQKN